jgi:uncharacterized Zn-binding protein involved in type VI secretion
MPGICRDIDTAGDDLIPSETIVKVNNELVILDGDDVTPHLVGEHRSATMVASLNTTVKINNKLVCVAGDEATCGDVATGSSDVFIG